MGSNKLPYFPFHADDWLNDPSVVQMDADTEGCYIRLLARSWKSPTPGVIFHGHVDELAGSHRLAEQYRLLWDDTFKGLVDLPTCDVMAYERWKDVKDQLSRAFDTSSRPEYWLQRRMISEYEKLSGALKARQDGAKRTNDARLNGHRNGNSAVTDTVTDPVIVQSPPRSPAEEVEVDLEVEVKESKSKHSSPNGSGRRAKGVKKHDNPKDREWMETFDEVWWPDYWSLGRKCSKAAAREVWAKIPHGDGQADFDRLSSAFDEAKADWRVTRSEPRFIPHAEKWLRDYLKNLILEA